MHPQGTICSFFRGNRELAILISSNVSYWNNSGNQLFNSGSMLNLTGGIIVSNEENLFYGLQWISSVNACNSCCQPELPNLMNCYRISCLPPVVMN